MGGAKIAVTVNANAEAKVTTGIQYGLQHCTWSPLSRPCIVFIIPYTVSITIPPKKNDKLTPHFQATRTQPGTLS